PKLLVLEVSPETVATSAWFLEWQVQRLFTWADWAHGFVPIVRYSHLTRVFASRVVPLYHYRYEIRKQSRNAVMAWAMRTPEEKPAAPAATPASAGNWTRTPAQAGLTAPTAPNFANVSWPQSCGDLPRWLRNYKVGSLEAEALERLLKRCEAQQI